MVFPDLDRSLRRLTAPARLQRGLTDGRTECLACALRCKLKDGQAGACKVRFRDQGRLMAPWGYVAGVAVDPIEKKPFFHVLPGAKALSFGMLGCCYSCRWCQNWLSSQAVRDPEAGHAVRECSAREVVEVGVPHGARVVASTYNEPLITSEWGVAVFEEARKKGMRAAFVSNGNATPEALDLLAPWTEFFKVDLKSFEEGVYRKLAGGPLKPVLDTIESLHSRGIWVEVVTLVIPGINDGDGQLRAIARFLASVSKDIPWHVTAFHGDYRMAGVQRTPAAVLQGAAQIGKAEGLRYVYAGNLPGLVEGWENTSCPGCGEVLVERSGFRVKTNRLKVADGKGSCPKCSREIAGRWM